MKLHVLYNFQDGPWGGGNQFLKALKAGLEKQGLYEGNPVKAEVILFNSHQQLNDALKLKAKYPQKVLIHRLGPVFHYHRGEKWKKYDQALVELSQRLASGAVFQSQWAFEEAKKLGFNATIPHKVIYNAVDDRVFNKQGKAPFEKAGRVKLVATSWSANPNKGFEIYKYLDGALDFLRYEICLLGNSPFEFKNIKCIKPVPSDEVAHILKQNDIFVFAAKNEACSNSLIEAISCGLPVVALDSGSNKELVAGGGELFDGKDDVKQKIEKVAQNYSYYQANLPTFSIQKTVEEYYKFSREVCEQGQPKKVGFQEKLLVFQIKMMRYVL